MTTADLFEAHRNVPTPSMFELDDETEHDTAPPSPRTVAAGRNLTLF